LIIQEDTAEGPVILVVGARPNFMKIAPLHAELQRRGVEQLLLHTGQHYDEKMSKVFFDDLGMPEPDIYLGIGSGTHSEQTAKVMVEFEKICFEHKPRLVVVVGDVNSTLACTLVAAKLNIKSAHVEAGLRSGDMRMPEEVNRIVTDSICNLLLTPSPDGDENLLAEGRDEKDIHFVGNIMIDSLFNNLEKAKSSTIHEELGITDNEYAVLTLHRPSNVDDPKTLEGIIEALEIIGKQLKLVFPIHPRTEKNAKKFDLFDRINSIPGIVLTGPIGYLDFISLTSNARIVLTDSGGLQEETTALKIPCITLRENTERPITVTEGTNQIVGSECNDIIDAFNASMATDYSSSTVPEKWDGNTASRIADIIQ
jgi:UDP-N-acetylglucosamine 2-epimerase (non-hydrolysing)